MNHMVRPGAAARIGALVLLQGPLVLDAPTAS